MKFRETRLLAVKFTQSGSRGKLLITFDQRGIIRFHKIRGLKALQGFDFVEQWRRLDYVFTNHIETTRIELKHEQSDMLNQQTSGSMRQKLILQNRVIDQTFGRDTGGVVRPLGAFNLEIQTIMYYAGHILAAYIG